LWRTGVSAGEQGGKPAPVGETAGESGLLPGVGKGDEGARLAGGKSGLLEAAPQEVISLTRSLASATSCGGAG